MSSNDEIIWEIRKKGTKNLIKQGKRSDGRDITDFRKIELKTGFNSKAEGSCWAKLGNTEVVVGIKMDVGEPYPDSLDEGVMVTNAEFSPIASPDFQSGPPREESIELARVVDRGIRESKMIDFKKLCVREGELVWTVLIDIHTINQDGNLIDAATIAAIKALENTYIPELDEKDRIIREPTKNKLPLTCIPIACTFAKINGVNVADPTLEEEKAMDTRLTISTTEDGKICAMQKEGVGSYISDEIIELAKTSIEKGKEIRKVL